MLFPHPIWNNKLQCSLALQCSLYSFQAASWLLCISYHWPRLSSRTLSSLGLLSSFQTPPFPAINTLMCDGPSCSSAFSHLLCWATRVVFLSITAVSGFVLTKHYLASLFFLFLHNHNQGPYLFTVGSKLTSALNILLHLFSSSLEALTAVVLIMQRSLDRQERLPLSNHTELISEWTWKQCPASYSCLSPSLPAPFSCLQLRHLSSCLLKA